MQESIFRFKFVLYDVKNIIINIDMNTFFNNLITKSVNRDIRANAQMPSRYNIPPDLRYSENRPTPTVQCITALARGPTST